MTVQLDHLLVPSANRQAAAELLAGPFSAVHVKDGLTFDFDQCDGPIAKGHYCFRVGEAEFDAILGRIERAGIAYRSRPHGPDDHRFNTSAGGRIVYWARPDGHVWELLTVSYAR